MTNLDQLRDSIAKCKQSNPKYTKAQVAESVGCSVYQVKRAMQWLKKHGSIQPEMTMDEKTTQEMKDDSGILTIQTLEFTEGNDPVEFVFKKTNIDQDVWEAERFIVETYPVPMKLQVTTEYDGKVKSHYDKPAVVKCWLIKVWVRRKKNNAPERTLEALIDKLKECGPIQANPMVIEPSKHHRQLEVSMFDPHFGMRCFQPGADKNYDMDKAEKILTEMLSKILKLAEVYGPFERIIFPVGNDYLHSDNLTHTTTGGTPQPEMDSWQEVYVRGEELAIKQVETLKKIAPVTIIMVPGNHDRQSAFTMGRLLKAYYHNDVNVEIQADSSPYKFYHYGVNLIGFEHGHSIKQTVRLAALMANECRDVWGETVYREWHLGDQHRKGSACTSTMEEQGVSVEYLPGLTPVNEWHKLKSFSWQKRAGMGFVWDKDAGPIARVQVNINNYTGEIM